VSKASTDDQLTRYLLGELPEGESAALEEEYFGDDACFERLLALEDELIDDYVRGALPATRHAQLDRRLRETGQWRRVQFARALSQRFGANSQTPRTAATRVVIPLLRRRAEVFVGALAAALLLFAVAAGSFSLRNAALRGELARAEELQRSLVKRSEELQRSLDAEQAQKEAALRQLNQAHAEGKTSKPARFLLLGTVRGGVANRIHLSPEVDPVVLLAPGEEIPYPLYRGTLRTAAGESMLQARLQSSSSATEGTTLAIEVPSRLLTPGQYVLTVEGRAQRGKWEGVRDYPFEVIRK